MRLKTYRARTMAEALAAVKRDLGKDAVILHTRTVSVGAWWRLSKRKEVEIIASDEVNVAGPRPREGKRRAAETREVLVDQGVAKSAAKVDVHPVAARAAVAAYGRAGAGVEKTGVKAGVNGVGAGGNAGAPEPVTVGAASGNEDEAVVLPVRQRVWRGEDEAVRGAAPARVARLASPVRVVADEEPRGGARAGLEAELADIKAMVSQVLQSAAPTPGGMMPEALFKHYLKLLQGQVSRDIADRIVGAVRDELNPGELADEAIVRQTMLRHVAALIPVAPAAATPTRTTDGRPLTIALVGPTGVGKTTTIAKLAATYKLRYGKRVGLITSDTYRIAAVEQLRTYANIIAVPLQVVMTPAEMGAACETLADCEVVLIDTAGRSQHDSVRLEELRGFVEAAAPHETHLVLSSAASEAVLLKTAAQFAGVRPNRLILTKLDEAVNFGVLVNVADRVAAVSGMGGAKLSYVTTGQEVPDHIEPGQPDRLARLVLDGEMAR